MPRTFKFSFPLPRRKSSSDKQPGPSPQRMYSDDTDDLPLSSPGVKAEKVLGTSDYNNLDLLEQPPRRPKRLRKNPSFMSVTLSDAGSESVKDSDDELSSAMSESWDRSQHRPSISRNQPSSPLLGQSFSTAIEEKASNSKLSSPKAHYFPSSSTLRSYYDATKTPLSVSQQTSASSARDMALRKGCPSISSPLARHDSSDSIEDGAYHDISPEPFDPQQDRPRHIDLSTLSPLRPPIRNPHVHSPRLYLTAPPQPSLLTRTHRSISDKTKWLGWERRKTKHLSPGSEQPSDPDSRGGRGIRPPNSHASNIDEPAHTWSDGFEPSTLVQTPELESRIAMLHHFPPDTARNLSVSRDCTTGSLRIGPDESKSGIDRQSCIPNQHNTSINTDPGSKLFPLGSTQQSMRVIGTPSVGSQKSALSSRSNRKTLSGIDLQIQSVLALSSSEDESEESAPSNNNTSRRHRIRESIDYADKGDEALVLSVERIKSIKPQPVVNVRSRRRSRSTSSEVIPPVPSIPTRPVLSQRVSSRKWQDRNFQPALEGNAKSLDCDSEPLDTGSRTSRNSRSTSSQRKIYGRESRMMAVTPDEEKLLEGMRRKRASIRHDTAADLYNVRDSITLRPKTAGEDKQLHYFDVSMSQSIPAITEELARTMSGVYAVSADDLAREIEYFPQVPEIPVRLRGHTNLEPSPKKSPSLTFTVSDLVPSTPTSRRSPITPPSGLGHLDAYSGGYAVSPSRSINSSRNKHERKRTVSSSVVVLDGAEQRAQQLDEEDEITGWAMNRW
ncbi:ATP-dependent DNA helicase MER3 [Physcia stellaris]|nr:ATP-dependent DNA helicase MER3 [Physcia stellaris]